MAHHIRYATLDDIPTLKEVYEHALTDRIEAGIITRQQPPKPVDVIWAGHQLRYNLREKPDTFRILVAEPEHAQKRQTADHADNRAIQGFLAYELKDVHHVNLHSFYTKLSHQKTGKQLWHAFEHTVRSIGAKLITLEASPDFVGLYRYFGCTDDSDATLDLATESVAMHKDLKDSNIFTLR